MRQLCIYTANHFLSGKLGEKRFTKAIIIPLRNGNENYRSRKSISTRRKCSFLLWLAIFFYIEVFIA